MVSFTSQSQLMLIQKDKVCQLSSLNDVPTQKYPDQPTYILGLEAI